MTKVAWNTMPGVAYIQKVQNVMIARLAGKKFPTPLDEFSFEDKGIKISIVLSNTHYDNAKSVVLGHIDGVLINSNDDNKTYTKEEIYKYDITNKEGIKLNIPVDNKRNYETKINCS